jgi:predicted HicB family RNase H-like nuclease
MNVLYKGFMAARKGRKRLAVDIYQALHRQIAMSAKKRNITISRWVTRAICRELARETQGQ